MKDGMAKRGRKRECGGQRCENAGDKQQTHPALTDKTRIKPCPKETSTLRFFGRQRLGPHANARPTYEQT